MPYPFPLAKAGDLTASLTGAIGGVLAAGFVGAVLGGLLIRAAVPATNRVFQRPVLDSRSYGESFGTALIWVLSCGVVLLVLVAVIEVVSPTALAKPDARRPLEILLATLGVAILAALLRHRHAGEERPTFGQAAVCALLCVLIGVATVGFVGGVYFAAVAV